MAGDAASPKKPLVIVDYDPGWPQRFRTIAAALRGSVGGAAARIDHIGSTSVPGLAAKDVIDVQVTVDDLDAADAWPDELIPGLMRRQRGIAGDHVPQGEDPSPDQWSKHYWSERRTAHVHVREAGRRNQRYALLFRDYLRADDLAAGAYAQLKWALIERAAGDWDTYSAVKDPACDLIIAAEQWAAATGWSPPPSDA